MRFASAACLASIMSIIACKSSQATMNHVKSDESALGVDEAAKIAQACSGVETSAYRRTSGRTGIAYSNLPKVASVASAEMEQSDHPPAHEEARFDGKYWLLSATLHGSPNRSECLRANRLMTTRQFIAALGCSQEDPCRENDDVCLRETCPRLDRAGIEKLPATDGARAMLGLALVDAKSLSYAMQQLYCDGATLKTGAGRAIGAPLADADQCAAVLMKTTANGFVCAWTGKAFMPASAIDGTIVGDSGNGGFASPADCRSVIVLANEGVMCSWSGDGVAPFTLEHPDAPIGSPNQYGDIAHCLNKIGNVKGKRICAWDGAKIRAFALATGAAVPELGEFTDYPACVSTITRAADVQSPEDLAAFARRAAARRAEELAGGPGWTWGACNDPTYYDHLSKRENGRMVCEGKIDTLYSWTSEAKIAWLSQQDWNAPFAYEGRASPQFAIHSAFATHGFGPQGIRIKLKKGARFLFIGEQTQAFKACGEGYAGLSAADQLEPVLVRLFPYAKERHRSGFEFILCSLRSVHSWSYGTALHYDEMEREYAWVQNHDHTQYELYLKRDGVDEIFLGGGIFDGHRFSEEIFFANLGLHRGKFPGTIYYSPSATDKTPEAHFATAWPTYINPGNSPMATPPPAVGVAGRLGEERQLELDLDGLAKEERENFNARVEQALALASKKEIEADCRITLSAQKTKLVCKTNGSGAFVLKQIFPKLIEI